jgi:uncharacterized protein (TIGR00730 family)
MELQRICVFCGASPGKDPRHLGAAQELGRELAQRGIELVTGGGGTGMMGAIADATLAAGGHVHGVIPRLLVEREVAHKSLTHLHLVDTMHERKALMAELSDAFIALPGGIGTLEELIEVYTWHQLRLHSKPMGVLNTNGYYDGLAAVLDHAVDQGFLPAATRSVLVVEDQPDALLDRLNDL